MVAFEPLERALFEEYHSGSRYSLIADDDRAPQVGVGLERLDHD